MKLLKKINMRLFFLWNDKPPVWSALWLLALLRNAWSEMQAACNFASQSYNMQSDNELTDFKATQFLIKQNKAHVRQACGNLSMQWALVLVWKWNVFYCKNLHIQDILLEGFTHTKNYHTDWYYIFGDSIDVKNKF